MCLSGWTEISVFSGIEAQDGVTFRLQVPDRWPHSRMHPGRRPLGQVLVSAASSGNSKEPAPHINSDPLLILLGTTHKSPTRLLQGRDQRSGEVKQKPNEVVVFFKFFILVSESEIKSPFLTFSSNFSTLGYWHVLSFIQILQQ